MAHGPHSFYDEVSDYEHLTLPPVSDNELSVLAEVVTKAARIEEGVGGCRQKRGLLDSLSRKIVKTWANG